MINSVLYGNGFNQLCLGNPSWSSLLELSSKTKVGLNGVTPTMQYEYSFLDYLSQIKEKDTVNKSEFQYKSNLAECLKNLGHHHLYDDLRSCGASLFLTPNYDYNLFPPKSIDFKSIEQDKSEKVYSIHRWYKIKTGDNDIVVYPFHGEIRFPKTIELGFDHYYGSIGKIDRYVKGAYDFSSDPGNNLFSILKRLDNDKDFHLFDFKMPDHGIPNILS